LPLSYCTTTGTDAQAAPENISQKTFPGTLRLFADVGREMRVENGGADSRFAGTEKR
jgi:hypothetical protein